VTSQNRTTGIFTINAFQLLSSSSSPFSYLPLPFISLPGFLFFMHFVLDLKIVSFYVEKCVVYIFVLSPSFGFLAWVFCLFFCWKLMHCVIWAKGWFSGRVCHDGCLWAGQKFGNFSYLSSDLLVICEKLIVVFRKTEK